MNKQLFLEEENAVMESVNKYLTAIKDKLQENKTVDFVIEKPERIVVNILIKKLKVLYPTSEVSQITTRDNHYHRIDPSNHYPYTVDECVVSVDFTGDDLKQFEIRKRRREIEELAESKSPRFLPSEEKSSSIFGIPRSDAAAFDNSFGGFTFGSRPKVKISRKN